MKRSAQHIRQRSSWTLMATVFAVYGTGCISDQTATNKPDDDSAESTTTLSTGSNSSWNGAPGSTTGNVSGNTSNPGPKTGPNTGPNTGGATVTSSATTSTTTTTSSDNGVDTSSGNSSDSNKPGPAWAGDDFEKGAGQWSLDGKVWQVGSPTDVNGPKPLSGKGVLGTVLNGDYPATKQGKRYRALSPSFIIPASGEMPRLRYRQWFDLGRSDRGETFIKIEGASGDMGKGWVLQHSVSGDSENIWGQNLIYFNKAHAGKKAQIAFELMSMDGNVGAGWFIDDIKVESGPMQPKSDDFEKGWGDWSVDGGIWNIGKLSDTKAPRPRSGDNVAGTVVSGNYPAKGGKGDTGRLVSGMFKVPEDGLSPRIRIHEWYAFGSNDYGEVQIRLEDGKWQIVKNSKITGRSGDGWKSRLIDLRAYKGKTLQVGFYFLTKDSRVASGWYLDDIQFELE